MFTRVILAAGVAALAISAPATAQRDRGGDGPRAERSDRGQQRAQKTERQQRTQRAERSQRVERQARAPRAERSQKVERQARAERQNRVERQARAERVQRVERQQRTERQQVRSAERQQVRENRGHRVERVADRQNIRTNRIEDRVDRQAFQAGRQQMRADRRAERQAFRADAVGIGSNRGLGYGVGGCPPGLADKGCVPPGQTRQALRFLDADAFRESRFARVARFDRTPFVDPLRATRVIGMPLASATSIVPLAAIPGSISYLYPDTDDYYYRYGGGYVYRVERDNDLIDWVLPLLAGGFMPGQYLPQSYMSSYVPNYYGFNSFYPDSPYDCNRYANGVIYEVDCMSGLIEDVNPIYASGYGVGQMLPSSYGYYNVPYQYRSLYYNNDDHNYWYAPGAIYQYDASNSLITSVAALLSPGFTIGQPLPAGYGMYNVPMGYRSTYFDTPDAWYRYNNGYIYQVDPTTQLVTAIVASILT